MDVPLQHVVGTVALIGLVVTVGVAYQATVSYIEANVYKSQLGQIAESVALNLVEVVSLTQFGGALENQTLIKTVNLPIDLNERAYMIRVVVVNETGQGTRYYLQAELVTRRDIYSRALIPISSNSTNVILKAEGQTDSTLGSVGTLQVRRGESGSVRYSSYAFGGVPNFVVWSWKCNSSCVYGGIGIWAPPGGT